MLLRSDDEAERLRTLCRFVTVDLGRGDAPAPAFVELGATPAAFVHMAANDASRAGSARAFVARIRREIAVAEQAHAALEAGVRDVIEGLRGGGKLDAARLQQGVDVMLDSITRSPDALPWVMEMRRKGDYIYQHGIACSIRAAAFGRHLGYARDALRELAVGALLCDVGKVRLPAHLLVKAGALTDDEIRCLRSHRDESVGIVAATPRRRDAATPRRRASCRWRRRSSSTITSATTAAGIRPACAAPRSRCSRASRGWSTATTPW